MPRLSRVLLLLMAAAAVLLGVAAVALETYTPGDIGAVSGLSSFLLFLCGLPWSVFVSSDEPVRQYGGYLLAGLLNLSLLGLTSAAFSARRARRR